MDFHGVFRNAFLCPFKVLCRYDQPVFDISPNMGFYSRHPGPLKFVVTYYSNGETAFIKADFLLQEDFPFGLGHCLWRRFAVSLDWRL